MTILISFFVAFLFVLSSPAGVIVTVAGGGSDENVPPDAAPLNSPLGVAVAARGDIYIADTGNNRIRRISATTGTISTIAGAFDAASVDFPTALALDASGNVYIAERALIRKIDAVTGTISTVAGQKLQGDFGDGGLATEALLSHPTDLDVDAAGNLYIADAQNRRIRKVNVATGIITTVAGNGIDDDSGDGGPATSASLRSPAGIALDRFGNLYIADGTSQRIRRVDVKNGIITTFLGNESGNEKLSIFPLDVAIDSSDNVFIADNGSRVLKVAATGAVTIVAAQSSVDNPVRLSVDADDNLYLCDSHRIRMLSAATGIISTIAGNGSPRSFGEGGQAKQALLYRPDAIAVDRSRNLYIGDRNNRIRKIDGANGTIAALTELSSGGHLAIDSSGNLFVADSRVRRIDASTGAVTIVAGTDASSGFSGDDGPATEAVFNAPSGIAVDKAGNLYVADKGNNRIRRVSAATGIITTLAGSGNRGFSGDGGPATSASLDDPESVAVDSSGNVYVADSQNHRIRKVDAATGIITTVAGNGEGGFSGDEGAATEASLHSPTGVAVDRSGNLYIADLNNNRVREVSAATGIITTIAGSDVQGFSGDGGPATSASLFFPSSVVVDDSGTLYIADRENDRIRAVSISPRRRVTRPCAACKDVPRNASTEASD